MKVLIVGGGYAGMSAALSLRERAPDAEIVVADARDAHLKVTRLHETLRHPLSARQVAFATLAERLGFRFLDAAAADLGADTLARCEREGRIALGEGAETFDYLLLAFGASAIVPEGAREHCYTLDDLARTPGERLIEDFVERTADDARPRAASVIGAGASGVQFVFELAAALREREADATVRLVDSDRGTLGAQPDGLDRYARERLAAAGIEFLPGYRFDGQRGGTLRLCAAEDDGVLELPSQLCLLMLGRETRPERLEADRHGRVRVDGVSLERVFAAGDCASYAGEGLDVPTAQAAIRKAKLAAGNIVHAAAGDALDAYDYREVGYVVSLGDGDAVGWLGRHERVLEGLSAAGVKELIETQYDLLLSGSDTYFDVNALQDKLAALTGVR